jgi:hypothetical protein
MGTRWPSGLLGAGARRRNLAVWAAKGSGTIPTGGPALHLPRLELSRVRSSRARPFARGFPMPERSDGPGSRRAVPTRPGGAERDDPADAERASLLQPGRPVRSKGSGRRGVIKDFVDEPSRGRSVRVDWAGTNDFSLMAPSEIEADPDAPAVRRVVIARQRDKKG